MSTGKMCVEQHSESQNSPGHIGYEIRVLDHMMKRRMENIMRKNGSEEMTLMNGWIIKYLEEQGDAPVYQKDLEQIFRIGKSSLAGTLKIMEEKGYIVRESVPGDARLKRLQLTDMARAYIHKIDRGKENAEELMCQGISKEERVLFLSLVKKMQDNLQKECDVC